MQACTLAKSFKLAAMVNAVADSDG